MKHLSKSTDLDSYEDQNLEESAVLMIESQGNLAHIASAIQELQALCRNTLIPEETYAVYTEDLLAELDKLLNHFSN